MLPINKVVLYKHGVGYFERRGDVDGEATIRLQFKSGEMNDVLKSLTVLDLSGGIISSISYESTKPVERQLEDIAIRLTDKSALTGLLSQVKGARISLKIGSEEITGTITGIEEIKKSRDDTTITTYMLTILEKGQTLKSFDVLEVKSITFLDENIQNDLKHLLEVLITAKKKDSKNLTIYAKGEGRRILLATYVVETPVWKASYRTILGDDKPVIQGWALVDNTQDEDWNNVNLTLVAGLPISFIHDLYSPRYKKRPVVEVKEEEAYAPPVLEESVGASMPMEMMDMECEAPPPMAAPKRSMSRDAAFGGAAVMGRQEARRKSVQVQTRTVEVGDLFQYEISNPVTVKRNQSALVPILQTEYEAKRVAVYNREVRDKNPMSALFVKNDTGLTLEGGPMTVIEEDTYVGEAMLDTLKPNEERIVPFSVELGCLVTQDHKSDHQSIHRVRIANGYMYMDYYTVSKNIYIIKNKKNKPIDLFLEHRFNHGWDLVDTPKPYEETENFYRFRMDAPAEKSLKFVVKEKTVSYESYYLGNITSDQVSFWLSKGYIDNGIKKKFEELLKFTSEISRLGKEIKEVKEEIAEIQTDQKRLRENLKALGNSQDEKKLKERYVKELTLGEDRLKELKERSRKLKDEKKKTERELSEAMKSIEVIREI